MWSSMRNPVRGDRAKNRVEMSQNIDTIVVGGGQAGLSVSWHLKQVGREHLVLDRAKIGSWVLVGAGAVVPPNTVIPSKSLVLGVPGKVVRALKEDDMRYIEGNAQSYAQTVEEYKKRGIQG